MPCPCMARCHSRRRPSGLSHVTTPSLSGTGSMTLLNSAFDFVFGPFVDRPPIFALIVFGVATGFVLLLTYRFLSNQRAIRRVKNLLQAHLLEVRLFQDQLGVVWRAYGKLLQATLSYLGWSLIPVAVVALPLTLLIAQLDLRFGSRPLAPGESALLVVHVDDPAAVDRVSLQLPEGVVETAPLVRIPAERQVVARLETRLAGRSEILVTDGAATASKEIVTGGGLERISAHRFRGGWVDRLLEPGEDALPRAGSVSSIAIEYPERPLSLGPVGLNWLVVYFVLTLLAAFVLKPFVGAEF